MVKNKQQQQSEGISIPRINDILLGRGGSSIHNQSNVRYRAMVRGYKKEYQTYTRLQKTQLAEQLVREWHDQTPPGRFLEKDEKVGKWFVIPEKTARRKTSQLLREGAPKIRRQLKSESQEKKKKQQEEQERLRAQSPPPQLVQAPPAAMTPSRTPVRSTVPATPNPPSSHHHLRTNEQEGSRPFFPPGQSYSVLRSPVPSHHPGYEYHSHHYDHSPYTPSYEYTPMSPPPPPSHYHSTPPPRWQPYTSGYHGPSPVPVPPTPVRAPATPKSALVPLAPKPASLDVEKNNNRTSNIIPIPFAPRPTTTYTKTPAASSSSASSTSSTTTTTNNKPAPLKPITPADVNQRNKLRKPPAVSRSNSCSSTGSENSLQSNKATQSSRNSSKPKAPSPESVLDFDYDLPPPSVVWSEDADDVDDDENIQVILGDHDTVSTLVEEFAPKALWERTPLEPLTEDEELCPPIPIRLGLSASRDESTSSSKCPQPFLTDTPASFSFSSWDCADVGVAERSSFDMMEKVIRAESDLDHTSTIDILNELDREMEAELLLPCHSF